MSIKVVIVENDKVYASALNMILSQNNEIECIGTYYSASDAITFIPQNIPDIILMDLDLGLGKMDGIETIRTLNDLIPNILFLVLTIFEDNQKVFDALSAGALGYILKSSTPEKIIESIFEIKNGGSPMTSNIARLVASSFTKLNSQISSDFSQNSLSTREKEIIELISNGKIEKEVADELFISVKTVKTHISNIYTKLQVHNRVDALNKYYGKFHS